MNAARFGKVMVNTTRMATMLLVCLGARAASATVIDDFTVANPDSESPLTVNSGTTTDSNSISGQSTSNIIGGVRESSLAYFSGSQDSNFDIFNNQLDFSNNPTNRSTATVTWDGNSGGVGDLNADLTVNGENAFVFDLIDIDQGSADFTVTVSDGTNQASSLLNASSAGNLVFWYNTFAGVDFTSVNWIRLTIDTSGTDEDVDLLGGGFETQNVPEPSTFALLGMLCVGLCVYQRRRKAIAHKKAKSN